MSLLEQAYHVILGCALIGLWAHDLRLTNRPGHHVAALNSLADTLDILPARIDYFQALRDLRNKDPYTGHTYISGNQAAEAVEEARKLVQDLTAWLAQRSRSDG